MQKIAILYQAKLPPAKDGIQKPLKPGGYSDSGADIACALYENGLPVVSSVSNPATETDLDWVFPDSKEGIQSAFEKGARIFWLNTVLFDGHPIEILFAEAIEIVGQLPKTVDTYDDKWVTNKLLRENGLSIPDSLLISKDDRTDYQSDFFYPGVVKPVRGRGSQGVYLVKTRQELEIKLSHLFDGNEYGTMVYFEQFLPGQEITVTVMPPGVYRFKDRIKRLDSYWSLPALKRFNHINDVAPYNGTEAVINNSIVLDDYD
ncbi:MAG: ATP-grasp domain-containing protein [Saprospiraceae bacterium]|nr:ATP-grasp domain-containing protein [Saprospiraceae bacterium]